MDARYFIEVRSLFLFDQHCSQLVDGPGGALTNHLVLIRGQFFQQRAGTRAPRCSPWRSPHCGAGRCAWRGGTGDPRKVSRNSSALIWPATPAPDSPAPDAAETPARRWLALCGSTGKHPGRCRSRKHAVPCPRAFPRESIRVFRSSGRKCTRLESSWYGAMNRVGGAGVDAARAGAAAVGSGQVRAQFQRSENHAEKQPRAQLLVDDAGILADPADAGIFRGHALDDGAGVDVAARGKICRAPAGTPVQPRLRPPAVCA